MYVSHNMLDILQCRSTYVVGAAASIPDIMKLEWIIYKYLYVSHVRMYLSVCVCVCVCV